MGAAAPLWVMAGCPSAAGRPVSLAFRCRIIGGQAHTGSEAKQIAWLTVDEAKREMVEARAVRVTDALSGNCPAVRTHDGTHLLDRS